MTEKEIQEKYGKGNPFTVPEGYFDQFKVDIMTKVHETKIHPSETHSKKHSRVLNLNFGRGKSWMAVAACLCAAVFALSILLSRTINTHTPQTAQASSTLVDTPSQSIDLADAGELEEYAEYAMLDNGDLYACLYE